MKQEPQSDGSSLPGPNVGEPGPMPRGRRLIGWVIGVAVIGILLGWWQSVYMARVIRAGAGAVAVLPFSTVGDDPSVRQCSVTLTQELAERLARVAGLRVVPSALVAQFKGPEIDLSEVAARTRATLVVEGSVRVQADRVRVVARIAKTSDGSKVWSRTFDGNLDGLPGLTDEMSQSVAGALTSGTFQRH